MHGKFHNGRFCLNIVINDTYHSQFAVDFGSNQPLQLLTTGCKDKYPICDNAVPYSPRIPKICPKTREANSSNTDIRIGYICNSSVNNGFINISKMCIGGIDLQPLLNGPIFFVTKVIGAKEPVHTGFSYNSPFLRYLVTQVFKSNTNQNTPMFVLDLTKPLLQFKNMPTFNYAVNWKKLEGHDGRSIVVSSIEGTNGSVNGPFHFTIDTGNDAFLSYDKTTFSSNNGIFSSQTLKFNILKDNTSNENITITFQNNHRCNKKTQQALGSSKLDKCVPYTHNVFANGFISNFLMGFYDSMPHTSSNPTGSVFFKVQPEVTRDVSITSSSTNNTLAGIEPFSGNPYAANNISRDGTTFYKSSQIF